MLREVAGKKTNKFLLAYRSTHCVTGVTPAELMYNRKLRTKLPSFSLESNVCNEQIRDRDMKCKSRSKDYFDLANNAKVTDVNVGDLVVLKQDKANRLSPNFHYVPYKVVEKKGNSVQVESSDGIQRRRNVIHLKKLEFEQKDDKNRYWEKADNGVDYNDDVTVTPAPVESNSDTN